MCFEPESYRKVVQDQFGMIPMWHSEENKGIVTIMLMNPENQTWTIVKGNSEAVCLIAAGQGFIPYRLKGDPS